jgi:curved DNA-binding protein
MADGRDYYEILGVQRNASQEDIQRAYRRLARTYHPDLNSDPVAEDRFKEISEAYNVLSDPATRRRYDAFGSDFRQIPEDVDPDAYRRSRAGAGAGAGRARTAGAGAGGAGGGFSYGADGVDFDVEDLFGGLFGGRSGRGWGPVPGADQEAELPLTVEEAYRGGRKSVTIGGAEQRAFEVNIPPGVTDGQRIRLARQGGRGSDGARSGDLYFIVRILPHPAYRVQGRDLYVDLRLAPWEAALGTSVPVDTPGGEAKVKVPPGTSCGKRLRLRGRGLPNPRGMPGDLFAEARIMVPPRVSPTERQLFEQLAAASEFDPRRRQ